MEKPRPYIKSSPDGTPPRCYIKWSNATEKQPYIKSQAKETRPYIKSNPDGTPSRWYIKSSKPETRPYIRWPKKKDEEKQVA